MFAKDNNQNVTPLIKGNNIILIPINKKGFLFKPKLILFVC